MNITNQVKSLCFRMFSLFQGRCNNIYFKKTKMVQISYKVPLSQRLGLVCTRRYFKICGTYLFWMTCLGLFCSSLSLRADQTFPLLHKDKENRRYQSSLSPSSTSKQNDRAAIDKRFLVFNFCCCPPSKMLEKGLKSYLKIQYDIINCDVIF